MARRQPSTFETLQSAHWGVGLAAGFIVLALSFVVIPAFPIQSPLLAEIVKQLVAGPLRLLVWLLAAMCWLASISAFVGREQRSHLLDTRSGLDSLRSMSWRQFEMLVGEAHRRLGYRVEETGLGGADGGVDLILRRDGRTTLVQCKQWRNRKVDARTVREQFGLLTHHGAEAVIIATVGHFTNDAREFAKGKPIQLLNGAALVSLVDGVRSDPGTVSKAASPGSVPEITRAVGERVESGALGCPRCGSAMVARTAKASGQRFLGCSRFPACRGTRSEVS